MSELPTDLPSLLAQAPELADDIAFARALRKFRVATANGEIPLLFSPGADNAIVDLRSLTPSAVPASTDIPPQAGHAGQILFTDGASTYWAPGLDAETITWRDRAIAAGGTFGANSINWADALIKAIKAGTFNSKIVALWPFLGGNLASARVPLRDALGVGISTNFNFVDADFNEASGLKGDGASKVLDTLIKPSDLNGVTRNGGIGFWVTHLGAATFQEAAGLFSTASGGQIFSLHLRSTAEQFWWGDGSSPAVTASASSTADYYGQRSSATNRKLYKNGVQIATNTLAGINDAGWADGTMTLFDDHTDNGYCDHRCGVAYFTDGTLTPTEIADLHTLLQTYLIGPAGR
jgi:hypothetical protein